MWFFIRDHPDKGFGADKASTVSEIIAASRSFLAEVGGTLGIGEAEAGGEVVDDGRGVIIEEHVYIGTVLV